MNTPPVFDQWLRELEARHLADLRVPEVTRALRALSSAYVERRHKVSAGATLDSAGKRCEIKGLDRLSVVMNSVVPNLVELFQHFLIKCPGGIHQLSGKTT